MAVANRESIHKAVDELPAESLEELQTFIAFLRHKERYPGSAWFRTLHDLFAPVRAEAADMNEDETNQLIDDALDEVRRERDS